MLSLIFALHSYVVALIAFPRVLVQSGSSTGRLTSLRDFRSKKEFHFNKKERKRLNKQRLVEHVEFVGFYRRQRVGRPSNNLQYSIIVIGDAQRAGLRIDHRDICHGQRVIYDLSAGDQPRTTDTLFTSSSESFKEQRSYRRALLK